MKKQLVIIAGPTASGKSALAMDLADHYGGWLLNGDSIQIYQELPLLSASPTLTDKKRVPHRLYGILKAEEDCSVARWLDLVRQEIEICQQEGALPVIVGGTGLYLQALLQGLSPVPEIEESMKEQAKKELETRGLEEIYQCLLQEDPRLREKIKPTDRQRVSRAWEVLRGTGRSILSFQEHPPQDLLPDYKKITILLLPPRKELVQKAKERLEEMFAKGAVEEVRDLLKKRLPPRSTLFKAIGVREIEAFLKDEVTKEEALARAQIATNQYIKRQMTWFRLQMKADIAFEKLYGQNSFRALKIMLKQQHLLEE